jgi:hypothetical protein
MSEPQVCVCRWTVQGYRANVLACRFPHAEREPLLSERQHHPQCGKQVDCGSTCVLRHGHSGECECECIGDVHGPGTCPA